VPAAALPSHTHLRAAGLKLQRSTDAIKHVLPHKGRAAEVCAFTIAAILLACRVPTVQLARYLVEGNPVQHWHCTRQRCSRMQDIARLCVCNSSSMQRTVYVMQCSASSSSTVSGVVYSRHTLSRECSVGTHANTTATARRCFCAAAAAARSSTC
jgi:hypothetical protein